ncbi:hypothetical protein OBBRIDRAFT_890988 [Obba rivulosa]|uniref:DUF6534 domain-containing protein n=1 Tax=Obba rivulosa TaxID=1052685 RepID=A0A8E2APS3_9APHY|nr:hypothetical protein OBBRIDRAFT_890988 [Obba rivulosa]
MVDSAGLLRAPATVGIHNLTSSIIMITPTVSNQLGPYLIGTILSSIIYGVTCVQVYIFFNYNKGSPKALKITIGILWILDTLHQIFSIIAVYDLAVTNFGNAAALGFPPWSNMASIPPFAFLEFIVKMIYVERIWRSSGKKWSLVVPIIVFSLIEFFAVTIFFIWGMIIDTFQGFAKLGPFSYVGLGSSAVADLLIAAIQINIIWKMRHHASRRTESLARTLTIYIINTQLLTSVVAVLDILTFALAAGTLIYTLFFNVLAKLLLSCCMAMLNATNELRMDVDAGELFSIPQIGTTASRAPFAQGDTVKSADNKSDSVSAVDLEARAIDD